MLLPVDHCSIVQFSPKITFYLAGGYSTKSASAQNLEKLLGPATVSEALASKI